MKKNLILVIDLRLDSADLYEIANRVARLDPGIAVHMVSGNETAEALSADKWQRQSVTILGGRQAMVDQFDAWTAAARALIRVTRAYAT